MKAHEISYSKTPPTAAMTYWVHRALDGDSHAQAMLFHPPRPGPVGGKGWPVLRVDVDGVVLVFTSLAELDTYVEVMSQQPLPSSRALSRGFEAGPNSHWLSRLPKKAKTVKHREAAVKYLRGIRAEFAAVMR